MTTQTFESSLVPARFRLTGTAALLLHNARLADPEDEYTRKLKTHTAKRNKTEETYLQIAEIETLAGLYIKDDDDGSKRVYIPGENIEACLREAAKMTKQGKNVTRGVYIDDAWLKHKGPKDPVEIASNPAYRDRRIVGIQRAKTTRFRPRFNIWSLDIDMMVHRDVFDVEDIALLLHKAGELIGLGDFSPRYGRFSIERL